jgi:hypothetical protein
MHQDGSGLAEHECSVDQDGHLGVGVHPAKLVAALLTLAQVNALEVVTKAQFLERNHRLEAVGGGKACSVSMGIPRMGDGEAVRLGGRQD